MDFGGLSDGGRRQRVSLWQSAVGGFQATQGEGRDRKRARARRGMMVRLAAVVAAGLTAVSAATANADEVGSRAKSNLKLCSLPLVPCNSGFYCSISGICKPMYKTSGNKRLVDEPCESGDDCLSGVCLDFPSDRCPGGSLFCTNTDLLPDKVCSCYNADMCITDYSKFVANSQKRDVICSKDNRCQPCKGIGCLVSPRKNVGEVCRDGGDCKSGSCHKLENAADGICVCNVVETCQGNQFCLEDDACSSGTCEKSRETQSSVLLEGLSTDVGLCTCSKKKPITCEDPAVCTKDDTCLLPQKGGASCKRGNECIGNCNDGKCSCENFLGIPCLEGQYCNSRECFEEKLGGEFCSIDIECSSKECKSSLCSCDSEHPCLLAGYYCDSTKACKLRKSGGERCDEVSSLQGDVCQVQGGCVVEGNKGSLFCKCSNEAGKEVTCSGSSVCKYDETCGLPSQGGETCAFDHECRSNNCLVSPDEDLGVCSCTEESTCVNPGDYCKKGAKNKDAWTCAPKLGPDEECELGEHCLSGTCFNGRCGCVQKGQSRAMTDVFTCPSDKYCDGDGSCAETKIYASECEGGEECKSGNCKSNTCLCMPPPASSGTVSSQEQAAADETCPDSSTLTCSEDAFCRVKTGLECPDSVASGANEGCADGACFEGKCGKGVGGDPCDGDDNLCQSGKCKDNVCTCDSSELHPVMCRSEAEFCDGDTSQCKPKLAGGLPCLVSGSSMPNQDICESGDCDMQGGRHTCKCSTTVECSDDDTYCKQESFTCESKALASEDCAGQPELDFCLTGTCLKHDGGEVCSCSPESPCPDQDASFCDLSLGLCLPKRNGGGPCNSDLECIHGTCAGNLCECNNKDTESCENPGDYCASNACLPKKENQLKCKKGFECLSEACNKKKFCECTASDGLSPCGEGKFCNPKSKKCSQLKIFSKSCKADGDCLSGKCNNNKKCGCRDEDCNNGKVCMERNNGNFNCVRE